MEAVAEQTFTKLSNRHIDDFTQLLGVDKILTGDAIAGYDHDETEDLSFFPELVLKPESVEELGAIMRICHREGIPVTPRGAGTGLSGGCLPVYGGVVISMEKFNRILQIDERNLQVTVEPGVITQVLQDAVKEKGLFYPPDPSSRGTCFIGGNIAENSGGPKAVKYGVVKDYVLNLEVVLPNGEVIWTGANVLKNATGYNLTQLMVGSEGTLGIITKAVLKLLPYPQHDMVMLVPFRSPEKACAAVSAIFAAGITPSALEFMERDAIDLALDFLGDMVNLSVPDDIQAHLLVEVDGNNPEVLMQDCERIAQVVEQFDAGEILFADGEVQKKELWMLRRNVAHGVRSTSIYKEEDTVVPRAELPVLLNGVKALGREYGFKSICYGHAGDGNLHVNIVKGDLTDEEWNIKLPIGIRKLFELVVSLGGTLSGEHGIGYIQKPYMDIAFNQVQLQLMRDIKKVFDPKGILNPGKIF
ncbi:MAG: FAD-linked oxidase C-terminal domain-containing protein [Chitinophagales bacterium]|nr:FAD-linked oxidase C-terminal domain-containing protein [Chitinophagales bacterium]